MKFKKILLNKKKCKPIICISTALFAVLLLILFIFFHRTLLSFIFTLMLIALGCFSSQFTRMTGNINFGLEFIPFVSILLFYSHGVGFGLVATILMMAVSSLLVGNIQFDLLVSAGIFVIIALLSLFLGFGIALNGIILVIIFNIISLVVLTLFGFDIVKNIIYFAGSITFNYILFKYFSEIIFNMLMLG